MRLYPISKKIGVIDKNTKNNLNILIKKMESKEEKIISANGCGFTDTYTTGGILKENGNAVYGGNVCGIVNNTSTVILDNKKYNIDNITGEVTPKKTTLKNLVILSSKKLISSISNVINQVKEHFDNPEVVKQRRFSIQGFTEKGTKRIEEAQRKIRSEMQKDNSQDL